MTLAELKAFIRLQLDEQVEAYYDNDDIETYIELAAKRFINKTKCIVLKKTFPINNTEVSVSSTAAAEVFDITCIADFTTQGTLVGTVASVADDGNGDSTFTDAAHGLNAGEWITQSGFTETTYNGTFQLDSVTTNTYTISVDFAGTDTGSWVGAGNTIGGEYFKIYDQDATEYLVWYDKDNGDSAPTGDNLIEVDISADDSSATVASATATAINATTGFTATVSDEVATVTLASGYVGATHANVDVANGGDTFAIDVTTAGIDGYYDLGYRIIKERGLTFIDEDGEEYVMERIAWEDWNRLDAEERADYITYVIDTRNNALYLPNYTSGTVYGEFYVHSDSVNLSTYLEDGSIPEEYHEMIANYALILAFRRDKQFDIANRYLSLYIHDERVAAEEVGNRLTSSQAGDFKMDIVNVHRSESELISSIYLI